MHRELSMRLYERYPGVFGQRDLPPSDSLMSFGIECGDGWFGILDALCEVLTGYAAEAGTPVVEAVQIKEKYGSLSVYTRGHDRFEDGAIDLAEAFSNRICEETGAPGRPCRCGGWLRTLSPAEAARQGCEPRDLSRWRAPRIPELDTTLAHTLAQRHPLVMVGQLDVPPGWSDLADTYLDLLTRPSERHGAPYRVEFLGREDGRLLAVASPPMGRSLDDLCGLGAFLETMSRRLDPDTGMPVAVGTDRCG